MSSLFDDLKQGLEEAIDYEKGNKPLIYISLGTVLKGKKTFFKEVVQKFDFEEKPKQKNDGKRYFILKI